MHSGELLHDTCMKAGDRVIHEIHGAGTIEANYSQGFAYRVLFDVQPVKAPNAWNNPLCVMGDTVKEIV